MKTAGTSMEIRSPLCSPEIWGGIECTINRVEDSYRDQLRETGYYVRQHDIDSIAALGIRKIRYPVLWEKHAPAEDRPIDWEYTSMQLSQLRSKNITPIVGLMHHGSGPAYTNLLDDAFPEKLAAYSAKVASQFPWVEYYTPVNEPLTTARFSGLYGFWYPHHSNERSFIQMLLNQVKGIILSMQAIRTINPLAQLVQTEDLCRVHSTPVLAHQAAFENERRWLTYDLLCGKFIPGHPLWNRFLHLGIPESSLLFFSENKCPPDIMGFNYYVTSERYLDHKLNNYPVHLHGGNGRDRYVDTDAARAKKLWGLDLLLQEAWVRYQLPLAVTECHLNCTREDQMRWIKETWDTCCLLKRSGIPVVAMTAWSLFGSCDWDSLLVLQQGHYESGVFDTSNEQLRPTILAKMISSYAAGEAYHHPLLHTKGWWHQPAQAEVAGNDTTASLLIVHAGGEAAITLEEICTHRRIPHHAITMHAFKETMNSTVVQEDSVEGPWGIVMPVTIDQLDIALLRQTRRFCRTRNIPLLIYMEGPIPHALQQAAVHEGFPLLIVQMEQADNIDCLHTALNLLIDEATGSWRITENGGLPIEIITPAFAF